jgi:hypothetical protein
MKVVLEQLLARALAVLWAGPLPVMALWVALGLLFVFVTVLAWRWETVGGALLAAVGIAASVVYAWRPPPDLPLPVVLATTAMFGVPPFVAGVLFLLHHRTVSLKR